MTEGDQNNSYLGYFQLSLCTVKQNKINHSTFPATKLAAKEAQVHAVGSNSLEATYILFDLPYSHISIKKADILSEQGGSIQKETDTSIKKQLIKQVEKTDKRIKQAGNKQENLQKKTDIQEKKVTFRSH